jgi:hypothetical protein
MVTSRVSSINESWGGFHILSPSTLRSRTIAAFAAAVTLTIVAPSAARADDTDWRAAAQAEIDSYTDQHPDDLTGIDQLRIKYGLSPMQISVSGVDGILTSAQAEQAIAQQQEAPSPSAAGSADTAHIMAVPSDAFTVWVSVSRDLYNNPTVIGNWNFRDNYVNGSAPDDVAAIQASVGDCYRLKNNGIDYRVSDYTGAVQSGRIYLYDGGVNGSPIIGVRDRVQGFRLLVDNGYFRARYERNGSCSSSFGGMFTYEHNQDGENGFSAGASWGHISISYSAQCLTLRKSTNAVWV